MILPGRGGITPSEDPETAADLKAQKRYGERAYPSFKMVNIDRGTPSGSLLREKTAPLKGRNEE